MEDLAIETADDAACRANHLAESFKYQGMALVRKIAPGHQD